MKKPDSPLSEAVILRRKAEEQLKMHKKAAGNLTADEADIRKLTHELQVHQIELEMQCDELTRAKEDAELIAQKFNELYDFAPMGYFTLDKQGVILRLNFYGARMLGKERRHLINKRFGTFLSDQTKPAFSNLLDNASAGIDNSFCEVTVETKVKNVPAYFYLSCRFFENTEEILLTAVDVTIQRIAEEKIIKSEAKYRSLVTLSPAGIYLTDVNGKCTFVNDAWCKMAGMKPDEAYGDGWNNAIHPDDRAQIFEKWEFYVSTGSDWNWNYRLIDKNGKVTWVYGLSKPVTDSTGKTTGFIGINSDITEIERVRSERHKSDEQFRLLSEQSDVGIGLYSPVGRILYFNNKALANMGGKSEDFIGKAFIEVFGKKEGTKFLNRVQEAIRLERNLIFEDFFESPSGKYWFSSNHSIVRDPAGKIVGIQVVSHDISERKKAEEQLGKSVNDLRALASHIVEVRETDRARIAHDLHDDLGQKLTALNMDISWIKSRMGVQSRNVEKKIQQMVTLINETMDSVQRISYGLRPSVLDDLGLCPAIEWQVTDFHKTSGISCNFSCSPNEIEVDAGTSLTVFRIVQEALTNIARHSGATRVGINISLTDESLEILIKDNGSGITPEKIKSSKSFGLIGIRERVRVVGGEVNITGRKGEGTRVEVVIPVGK